MRREAFVWAAALVLLSGLVVAEGRRRTALEAELPVFAPELYRLIARAGPGVQVVDLRDAADSEDARVPGAIPMPGCDPAAVPASARGRLVPSLPTVLVTPTGDRADARRCAGRFPSARLLGGGMRAWSDAGLPEDAGAYAPPAARAGGGCL